MENLSYNLAAAGSTLPRIVEWRALDAHMDVAKALYEKWGAAAEKLTLHLAPGGSAAVILTPAK